MILTRLGGETRICFDAIEVTLELLYRKIRVESSNVRVEDSCRFSDSIKSWIDELADWLIMRRDIHERPSV